MKKKTCATAKVLSILLAAALGMTGVSMPVTAMAMDIESPETDLIETENTGMEKNHEETSVTGQEETAGEQMTETDAVSDITRDQITDVSAEEETASENALPDSTEDGETIFTDEEIAAVEISDGYQAEIQEARITIGGELPINESTFPDDAFRNNVVTLVIDYDHNGSLSSSEILNTRSIVLDNSWGVEELTGIEYFTNLEFLNCDENNLESLNVSNNTELRELRCCSNQLTDLYVGNNKSLESLSCSDNQLSSLDVSNNTKLKILRCDQNQLSSLDVKVNTNLEQLWCYSNNLSSLDVDANASLKELWCDRNHLSRLDVSSNPMLKEIKCYENQMISLNVSGNPMLEKLYCFDNNLSVLNISKNPNLRELWCDRNQLTSLNVSDKRYLGSLICYENQLSSLDVSGSPNLGELWCDRNQLSILNVSNNPKLEQLCCYSNRLTSLDVSGITNLKALNFAWNQLESINVSGNEQLKELYCFGNRLSSLDVSRNPNLKKLWCDRNRLTSLDVSNNPNLKELKCYENRLSSLDVSSNPDLDTLECDKNQLSSLDVSNNLNLDIWSCNGNKIDITVAKDLMYDLAKLPGTFDVSRASDWEGGTVEGNILTVDPNVTAVTYTYNLDGKNPPEKEGKFTLGIVMAEEPDPTPTPKPVIVGKVTNLKLTSDDSSVKLSWKKASNASGYKVERYNSSKKKYSVVATVKGTSYTNKNLSAATAYQYRVRGYATKNGKTTYGSYSAVGKILTAPAVPSSVRIKRSGVKTNKAKAILTFKQSTGATYYDIYKYNSKTRKYTIAFRVKGKTLYSYNSTTKKYQKVNSVKIQDKVVTCTLINLRLKSDTTQKYMIKAAVQKSGYGTKTSNFSKVVTLK